MRPIVLVLSTALAFAAPPPEKKTPSGVNSDETIEVRAIAFLTKEEIKQELGAELDPGIVVIRVRLKPESDRKIVIQRDDFLLRSDKDGQRSQPFAPTQIAGTSVLVIGSSGTRGGPMMAENRGPAWGGLDGGPPRRLPGDGAVGGTGASATGQASVITGTRDKVKKENPLLDLLEKKILAEGELAGSSEGLLYFMLEGRHKVKDLELIYKSPVGRVALRFR